MLKRPEHADAVAEAERILSEARSLLPDELVPAASGQPGDKEMRRPALMPRDNQLTACYVKLDCKMARLLLGKDARKEGEEKSTPIGLARKFLAEIREIKILSPSVFDAYEQAWPLTSGYGPDWFEPS